jgi:hypothetical protein
MKKLLLVLVTILLSHALMAKEPISRLEFKSFMDFMKLLEHEPTRCSQVVSLIELCKGHGYDVAAFFTHEKKACSDIIAFKALLEPERKRLKNQVEKNNTRTLEMLKKTGEYPYLSLITCINTLQADELIVMLKKLEREEKKVVNAFNFSKRNLAEMLNASYLVSFVVRSA